MKLVFMILEIFLILLAISPLAMAAEKTCVCLRLSQDPEMDGRIIDDPAWQNIKTVSDFIRIDTKQPASKATSFRIGYTPDALYLGITCREPEIGNIHSNRKDGDSIWLDESIEIFLMPVYFPNYFHFVINTEAAKFSAKGSNPNHVIWNWQGNVYKTKDDYSVEIRIPFETLKNLPAKNEVWRFNICRNVSSPEKINITWSDTVTGFHDSKHFAKVSFTDEISVNESLKTRMDIVRLFADETSLNLQKARNLAGFVQGTKNTMFQKDINKFFLTIERKQQAISQVLSNDGTIEQARTLCDQSYELLKQSDDLSYRIALDSLFNN